jgi:probable F420-dependent oxidoreductase
MKLTVEFPSVAYREGPEAVARLARAIEEIGYDGIDMFDHVVMPFSTDARPAGPYPAKMPILEALVTLGYLAAITSRVTLGTEVLVLPQRQPALVAKQVSTLDTLSGGRVRLGVGIGWQPAEFEALGEEYDTRGTRMDEAIVLLRAYWSDERVDVEGKHYRATAMAMEPKPPQGRRLPIWIGGSSEAAYRRVGRLGDGWLAGGNTAEPDTARRAIESIRRHAEAAGRDPATIGLHSTVASPPSSPEAKRFFAEHASVVARVIEIQSVGFQGAAINATAIFQAGARSVDAMIEALGALHDKIRAAVE